MAPRQIDTPTRFFSDSPANAGRRLLSKPTECAKRWLFLPIRPAGRSTTGSAPVGLAGPASDTAPWAFTGPALTESAEGDERARRA